MTTETKMLCGLKIGFVLEEDYFKGFHTPSMYSTAKATGADMVVIVAKGKTPDDITEDDITALLAAMGHTPASIIADKAAYPFQDKHDDHH